MDEQIDYFANTRQDIISSIGGPAARKLLKTALVAVTIGANDFINNYLTPVLSTPVRETVSPEKFVGFLIARFRLQLTVRSPYNFALLFNAEMLHTHILTTDDFAAVR